MAARRTGKSGRPVGTAGHVKHDLLTATIRLLNTSGAKGATSRAICEAAGVGAPVLYHHYGDLNGLYQAAIDESFRTVAACYTRSARIKGPLQGIRDSWNLFMHFAYEQPRMCRIVIEHILEGEPPRAVASTLQHIARDIAALHAEQRLKYSPQVVSQMLWFGALGAVAAISTARADEAPPDQAIHRSILEAILAALFVKPKTTKKAPRSSH